MPSQARCKPSRQAACRRATLAYRQRTGRWYQPRGRRSMRTKAKWVSGVIVMVALGFAFAGAPLAQTTSTVDVRNFEVISVDGNKLVVRDERGTNELTVPDDFRFTVDGKKMSV